MGESLNQPSSVWDECPMGCKPLLQEGKMLHVWSIASILRIRTGYFRASSRGNTEGPGVIRIYWV